MPDVQQTAGSYHSDRTYTRKWYVCDKLGWPIEKIRGRWFLNLLRTLIHGRKLRRLWSDGEGGIQFHDPRPRRPS